MERCPHSSKPDADPRACSLCVAAKQGVVVHAVDRDPSTGAITVDGVPLDRAFAQGPSAALTRSWSRGSAASGRAKSEARIARLTDEQNRLQNTKVDGVRPGSRRRKRA